ncbi:DUF3939 domain-containing protein [Thalassobacillus hwangdonensis]|uniref:DUF3939 domain-containing protein n=1 Tax=Thalassobacillus hwangdonensis TaxID=546108 RepID=A0ABW3KW83_9BACI
MWKRKKQKKSEEKIEYEKRSIPIEEVRKAIHQYAAQMPDGVPLSVIIHEDLTIDYDLLSPYLNGIPTETYYMSKETYELFPEQDYQLAKDLDTVQRAVDHYIKSTKEVPVIDDDPSKRVSFFKLEREHLLPYRPGRDFYITDEEFLVTYKAPK